MGKTSKSTRKFQNKHLKHTLEHRREVQKENKKYALRKGKGKGKDGPAEPQEKKSTKPIFDDMSVDEFFEGGFEVPKPKKGTKIAEASEDSDEESGSEAEIEDGSGSEDEDEAMDDEEASSEEEDEEKMKEEMAALAENDPEFFQYLEKNDKNLLDFEGVNPLDAMSDNESESEEEPKISLKKTDISKKLVAEWGRQLKEEPTLKLVQEVTEAFKYGVLMDASDEDETDTPYRLKDPSVFTSLMFVGLKQIPVAVQSLCPYKVKKEQRTLNEKHKSTAQITQLMRVQADAYLALLRDVNNTETAALVLSSVLEVLPYLTAHKRVFKQVIHAIVNIWANTNLVQTQVAAYAFMNNAAREFPQAALEIILRDSYSLFLKNCRTTNAHTLDSINFAKNSAAELFGIDEQLSYTVGFEYVRQLAVHLRDTISSTTSKTADQGKDAYKTVYNWQFCHSLDFWSRVAAQLCNPERELLNHKSQESPLRSLIYPLVQVTLGTIRLIPTAQFFPLRFYLIRSLIRLSQGSGVYIPIYPLLAEILTSTAFTKPPKNSPLPALEFEYIIRVGQQYLGTRVYQDGLQAQFIELTSEFLVLYCKSIAFPELVTPVILSLRRFAKKSKNGKFNKQIQQLVEKLNANASYITSKRSDVEYGPSNKAEVQAFLKDEKWESTPLGQYVSVHRKTREAQAQLLKQAVADEEAAKAKKKLEDETILDAMVDEN